MMIIKSDVKEIKFLNDSLHDVVIIGWTWIPSFNYSKRSSTINRHIMQVTKMVQDY